MIVKLQFIFRHHCWVFFVVLSIVSVKDVNFGNPLDILRFLIVVYVYFNNSRESRCRYIWVESHGKKFITAIINQISIGSLARFREWINFSDSIYTNRLSGNEK